MIKHPDGTTQQIDDTNLVNPRLAFDPSNVQVVAASKNGANSDITFFSATSTKMKQFVIQDTGCYSNGATPYAGCSPNTASGSSNMKADVVAASSTGYVAVGGPIPYDATATAGGSDFIYGSTPIVHALRWITATKLLVSLESNASGKQGPSISMTGLFDVTLRRRHARVREPRSCAHQ